MTLRFGPTLVSCERHRHILVDQSHFISANVPRRSVVQVGNEHHSSFIGLSSAVVPALLPINPRAIEWRENPSPTKQEAREQQPAPFPSLPGAEERATFYSFDDPP